MPATETSNNKTKYIWFIIENVFGLNVKKMGKNTLGINIPLFYI